MGIFSAVAPVYTKVFEWILRYGIGYGFATLVACLSEMWLENASPALASAALIVIEDVAFYPVFYGCEKVFFSKDQHVLAGGKESLRQLILVETADKSLRFSAFLTVTMLFPDNAELAIGVATVFVDLTFICILERSKRLLEIVDTIMRNRSEIAPLRPLGLA